ncbi:MAG: DUF4157 domain-containing protein [Pseudomonadota bacterium]|nr:DUF4157 domain-containing protein [Pseudomonadota bacterium]
MATQRHAPLVPRSAPSPSGPRVAPEAPAAKRSPEWAARAQGRLGNAGVQELLAAKAAGGAGDAMGGGFGARAAFGAAKAGGGAPLPFVDEMEAAFGEDFSDVRAHLGRGAAMGGLGAHAAASGDRVAFAGPSPTKEEVAHELVHVVQARRAGGGRTDGSASEKGAGAESEAEAIARRVAAGQPAGAIAAAPAGEVHGWWWDDEEAQSSSGSDVASGSCAQSEDDSGASSGGGYAEAAPSYDSGGYEAQETPAYGPYAEEAAPSYDSGGYEAQETPAYGPYAEHEAPAYGPYAEEEAPAYGPYAEAEDAPGYAPAPAEEQSWWDELWADEEEKDLAASEGSWWDDMWGGGGAEGAGPTADGHGGQGGGSGTGYADGPQAEDSLDPSSWTGSPMKFTFGGMPFTVGLSDSGAVIGGSKSAKAEWEAKKVDKSFQTQLAPGLVATAGVNVGTGMTASGNLSFSASSSTNDVPMGATDGSVRDTVSIAGNLSLAAFAKGEIKGGIGAGVANVASVTGNLNAAIAATGSSSIGVTGTATRVGNPRNNTWGDWQGSIDIPAKLQAEVSASLSASLDYKVLFIDGTWAEIELAKWVLGSGDILCNARIGIPSGETIDTAKSEFKFNELSAAPFLLAAESPVLPPYRSGGGGASGAAPEGSADDGGGGAGGAPPSSGGHGGAGA